MTASMEKLRSEILESEKGRYDLVKWKLVLVSGLGATGLGLSGAATARGISHLDYVLCLIPLVCVYVDVLCAHMNLRIMVIGCYLRHAPEGEQSDQDYEQFADDARHMPSACRKTNHPEQADQGRRGINAFELEDWALQWSTVVLSLFVIAYGSLTFSGNDKWWQLLLPAVPTGLLLAWWMPRYCDQFPKVSLSLIIIFLLVIPYFTVQLSANIRAWVLFLTSGMLGLLLSGLMQLIYVGRSGAIEALAKQRWLEPVHPAVTST